MSERATERDDYNHNFSAGELIADALGEIAAMRRGTSPDEYDSLDHIEKRLWGAIDRLREIEEAARDEWTDEGLAKRLTLMAKHGDHLTVGERNACYAAARRLRSPGDRGGDVFPGSCPKCGGKASDSGVGTYVCDDGCGWWIKHEDWSLTTHIRVSEPVLKAASTDAPEERCTCVDPSPHLPGDSGVVMECPVHGEVRFRRAPTDEAPERYNELASACLHAAEIHEVESPELSEDLRAAARRLRQPEPAREPCTCDRGKLYGTERDQYEPYDCPRCGGTGFVAAAPAREGERLTHRIECSECDAHVVFYVDEPSLDLSAMEPGWRFNTDDGWTCPEHGSWPGRSDATAHHEGGSDA